MHEPQVAFTEILGQIIRRHRQSSEITQKVLAPRLDITPSVLSRIESGRSSLTVVQLRRVGQTIGVPAWQLLQEAEGLADRIPLASPGVQVVEERPKVSGAAAAGWFLGGAAIGALVASLLGGSNSEDEEGADEE